MYSPDKDPIGALTWCVRFGGIPNPRNFSESIDSDWSVAQVWADLRLGLPLPLDNSSHDVFLALERSSDVQLWKWASSEQHMQRHPITGDTVFHLLCRSGALNLQGKLEVLADLKAHYRNPLTPNYRNELCIDLTANDVLRNELRAYMCWQPLKLVMEWFGPGFRPRAWALLLVCHRLKCEHPRRLAGLDRAMCHLLVTYLTKIEHIYVPSVPQHSLRVVKRKKSDKKLKDDT